MFELLALQGYRCTMLDLHLAVASTSGQHSGGWLFVVISAVILVFALTTAINPRLQWKMSRWQFKNRQALEPSAAGLVMARVISVIVAIVAVVFIVIGVRQL